MRNTPSRPGKLASNMNLLLTVAFLGAALAKSKYTWFVSRAPMAYEDAADYCHRRDAWLAVLDSKDMMDALPILQRSRDMSAVFIGRRADQRKSRGRMVLAARNGNLVFEKANSRTELHVLCQKYRETSKSKRRTRKGKGKKSESSDSSDSSSSNFF